jgi:hypothetical protein
MPPRSKYEKKLLSFTQSRLENRALLNLRPVVQHSCVDLTETNLFPSSSFHLGFKSLNRSSLIHARLQKLYQFSRIRNRMVQALSSFYFN